MNFEPTPEQRELQDGVVRFCRERLWFDDMIRRDHEGEFNWEGWRRAAEFGFQGMPIPQEYGGQGYDILSTALAMEALGYGSNDAGLALAIGAHLVICEIPIWRYGTEEQRRRYLPDLASGRKIGAYALTEPEAGSDAFSLRATATRRGDRWLLSGQKTFITNGPIADVIVTFATADRSKGARGVTAFIVEKGFPGFKVNRELDKMGLRTSPTGELFFENCEVPEENVLGEVGGAAAILHGSLEWERSLLLTRAVGDMRRKLEKCVEYANVRVQFGQPTGKNQAIAHKLADMRVRIEAARLFCYQVAWLKSQGRPAMMEAAIAKLFTSEARTACALDAIQIHGGYGFMKEYEVERDLRDSLAGTIGAGSSEIQRNIIARLLGL